jgi:Fic family protein
MNAFNLTPLPPSENLETEKVLKALVSAHRYLAELKGISESIPNQKILINTLSLQEAKDSSAIENIITTHDELYKETIESQRRSGSAKEVEYYARALKRGFERVSTDQLLTNRHILEIQSVLEQNEAGFRKIPGTKLVHDKTGEIVYTPPQDANHIITLMTNLETYINDNNKETDPLIKMAVIHYQFESIHPFYDGNGRTGRIINMLYLVLNGLLTLPILYMSRYIIETKDIYYKQLQYVREENQWEEWLLYMIHGVESTAIQTITIIREIKLLFTKIKHDIRKRFKFYSQDLINNLFAHPYTKIEFLVEDLNVSRLTATKYLNILAEDGILQKKKIGRSNFYVNTALFDILLGIEGPSKKI